ncbi:MULTISPECIES: hypothetical protein [Bacillaceae]|uniref:Uncharacterized protein n=1 Tax=Niallia hominis TaxID=3133173 RepID=A0ABV1F5D0_9BACI|nr:MULTISPECIES: hypothetical protein [Bacillaceae]MCF2649664.1 hypothetical protein [Niallia circulans]
MDIVACSNNATEEPPMSSILFGGFLSLYMAVFRKLLGPTAFRIYV